MYLCMTKKSPIPCKELDFEILAAFFASIIIRWALRCNNIYVCFVFVTRLAVLKLCVIKQATIMFCLHAFFPFQTFY